MKNKLLILLVIILFSLPAILPLFNKGFFQSDDGEWMIIRSASFFQSLRDFQFPVRYLSSLNHGYGYPVANFLYPGFLYLSVPIHILGFGFVNTIKIILGLSMIASSIFSFLWLSKLFNKFSAFIGSMFYLYLPYHLYDLYKRGSVGEVLALSVVPFILWQIERKSLLWVVLGIGSLILAHNTLALLFLPIIIFYMFIKKNSPRYSIFLSVILGLGISSFFSIPALLDLQYTVFFKTKISEWQNYFADISLISYLSIIVLILSIIIFLRKKAIDLSVFFLVLSLISLFFSTASSISIWKMLPISFVQFPFRFLSIEILAIAYLASFIFNNIKGNLRLIAGVILIILIYISSLSYQPLVLFDKGDLYYSTNEDSTTVKNEYLPIWVKNNPLEHYKNKVEIADGIISDLSVKTNKISFISKSKSDTIVTINTMYFPGWKVNVDSSNSKINYLDSGLIKFNIASGKHKIEAYFSETPVRIASDIVSIVSLFVLFGIFINKKGRKII